MSVDNFRRVYAIVFTFAHLFWHYFNRKLRALFHWGLDGQIHLLPAQVLVVPHPHVGGGLHPANEQQALERLAVGAEVLKVEEMLEKTSEV